MDTLDPENPPVDTALYANVNKSPSDIPQAPPTPPLPGGADYQNVNEINRSIEDPEFEESELNQNDQDNTSVDVSTQDDYPNPGTEDSVVDDYTPQVSQEEDYPQVEDSPDQGIEEARLDHSHSDGIGVLPAVGQVYSNSSTPESVKTDTTSPAFISQYSSVLVMKDGEGEISGDLVLPSYLVCLLCFCMPMSCWAICYAWNLKEAKERGDWKMARHHAKMAKTFMGLSIVLGVLLVTLLVLLLEDVWDVI